MATADPTYEQREQALKEQANKGTKMIWVTFRKEGIHKYPAALDDPKLATGDRYDVSFLGYPHRHIFHFKVAIEVFHDDRDIEFIQFKRWIEDMYSEGTLKLDYKSCEMMSDDLYVEITKKYYTDMKNSLDQDIDYLEKSYNIKTRQNRKKKSIFKHGNLLSYKVKDKT